MYDIENFHLSPFWDESAEVKTLIAPLSRNLGITYFDYTRFYKDNTSVAYFSDQEYVASFMRDANYERPTFHLQPGMHLWQSYIPDTLLNLANQHFSYFHGVTIYNKGEEYEELINFSGPQDNKYLLDIYINKFDLLSSFVDIFKAKIENHVRRNYSNRIMLPTHYLYKTQQTPITESEICNCYEEILQSVKKEKNQKIIFANDSLECLNAEEFTCLRHLMMGCQPKKIAMLMNLPYHKIEILCDSLYKKTNSINRNALLAQVQQGKLYFVGEHSEKVPVNVTQSALELPTTSPLNKLSPQEAKVSSLLVLGKTAKEIANSLELSYRTVEHYIENIKSKFGVKRRANLVSSLLSTGYFE